MTTACPVSCRPSRRFTRHILGCNREGNVKATGGGLAEQGRIVPSRLESRGWDGNIGTAWPFRHARDLAALLTKERNVTRNRLTAIVVLAILAIAGGVAFAVSQGGDHMGGNGMARHESGAMSGMAGPAWTGSMMDMGGMPGMSMNGNGAMLMDERAFLAMMVPHHQMAVEMARIVLDRGRDAEVKEMARAVITDQEKEIGQMRGWYRDWFGGTDPPQIDMSGAMMMMGMSGDMGELESTNEPDRVFLRMMIPHHAGALLMADAVLAGSPRAEVAALATAIVAAQSTEIGDMQRVRVRIAPPLG